MPFTIVTVYCMHVLSVPIKQYIVPDICFSSDQKAFTRSKKKYSQVNIKQLCFKNPLNEDLFTFCHLQLIRLGLRLQLRFLLTLGLVLHEFPSKPLS